MGIIDAATMGSFAGRGGRLHRLDDGDILTVERHRGASTPVLLVHGWGCDHTVWEPLLSLISTNLHSVVVDLRGHGRSTVARTPHTIARMSDDLAVILDQLHLGPVVVVGHSMGANVAVDLAVRHPQHVASVVSIDPAYGDPAWADAPDRAADLAERGVAAPLEMIHQAFHADSDPQSVPAAAATLRATDPRVLMEALYSTYTDPDAFGHLADTHRKLAELAVPLLSIYADPVAAERARYLPLLHRVELIQRSGHFIPLEQPEALRSLIIPWVNHPESVASA